MDAHRVSAVRPEDVADTRAVGLFGERDDERVLARDALGHNVRDRVELGVFFCVCWV